MSLVSFSSQIRTRCNDTILNIASIRNSRTKKKVQVEITGRHVNRSVLSVVFFFGGRRSPLALPLVYGRYVYSITLTAFISPLPYARAHRDLARKFTRRLV
jgi:hypothetical protein